MEALSNDELSALLQAAERHSQRNHLMLLMTFSHGLRASEVLSIVPNSVRDGMLTIARLKGSKRTVQPLVSSPVRLLDEASRWFEYTLKIPGDQKVFPIGRMQFWRLMQRYGREANIPGRKRHPHVLKHTIAMQIIHSAGIENTRQYLGHKSISSTGEYLVVSDADASAAVAAALGDPRV